MGIWGSGLEFRVEGSGFGSLGLRFGVRVKGIWFRGSGLDLSISGFGFRVERLGGGG